MALPNEEILIVHPFLLALSVLLPLGDWLSLKIQKCMVLIGWGWLETELSTGLL
jgi:hypothetical protein